MYTREISSDYSTPVLIVSWHTGSAPPFVHNHRSLPSTK
ncbi:uncharacterized protein METZ01_LOCUS85317, partial [marine metagenome]